MMKFEETIEGLRNGKHYGSIATNSDGYVIHIGMFIDTLGALVFSIEGRHWYQEPGGLTLEDLQAEWQEIVSVDSWK